MRVLDRYLLVRFLVLLAGILASCQLAFVVIDFIGNLDRFLNAPITSVALYYLYLLPYITTTVFPIAMLMAAMFTTGALAMHNEILAMQGAGIGIGRIVAPLFLASAVICGGILLFSETVLPEINRKKTEVLDVRIRHKDPRSNQIRRNLYYEGKSGAMYRLGELNGEHERATNVLIQQFENRKLIWSAKADSMAWRNSQWTLFKGTRMRFDATPLAMESFDSLAGLNLQDEPAAFLVTKKFPDDMNFFELRDYIDQIRRSGGDTRAYQADLHFKIAYPLINLIVVLLGVSLTTRVGRRGMARVFGVGLVACFSYYILAKLGLAMGHSGTLPPLLAAWAGNLLFAVFGLVLFYKATR